jgi:hypothetical protein
VQADGRIVASGRGELFTGTTQVIALGPLEAEVEGTVTANGVPPPKGVRLKFQNVLYPGLEWDATFDAAGAYRVSLEASRERVCAFLERDPPINPAGSKCGEFHAGLQRFDVAVSMPPGVIHIDVPAITDPSFNGFGQIFISSKAAAASYLTSFKFIRGLRGEYMAHLDKEYEIVLMGADRAVIATQRVTLTAERPEVTVKLAVAASR